MKSINDVINDNKYIINNDNNVSLNNNKDYSISKNFKLNTEESSLAYEIAEKLDDTGNFACFFDVVNKNGCSETRFFLSKVLGEINGKSLVGKYESSSVPFF